MSPYLAEFIGTLLVITFGDGVVASVLLKGTKSENAGWLTVVIGWGIGVTIAIYCVGTVSAHLNPAVSIAFAINKTISWSLVPGYCLAQVAGAATGATLVWLFYLPHWKQTDNAAAKLGVFCTSPAIRSFGNNLFNEVVATIVLILGLFLIGANKFADGFNPVVVGLLIIAIGLGLGGTTGFAINPARDLGPRLAHFILPIHGKGSSDWSYAWIPVVGPIVGGVLAAFLFQFIKV